MTELFERAIEVRLGPSGELQSVRTPAGWRTVARVVNRWLVETDWWREIVMRDYRRVLTGDGQCLELYRDLGDGSWHLSRRYD
ncbi:MAG: hypothetical protein NVSMB29_04820 [Candidatus Dormibacteria bacterium]